MLPHLLLQAELAAETVAIERDKHARLQSEPLLAQQIDALRAECVCSSRRDATHCKRNRSLRVPS
jgi:hypothetical protein